jgi:hypothetical protein
LFVLILCLLLLLLFAVPFLYCTYFALRLCIDISYIQYNYDMFILKMYSFLTVSFVYVNMLIFLYFRLLYCHWLHCVVRVVLGVTNELYVFLLCCLILCACPR